MEGSEWPRGCIQVYTGDGKGKTTAALGLALRAAGAGLRVFIAQFIKGMHYSELVALERFSDLITIRQYGRGCFIRGEPSEEDRRAAVEGLARAAEVIRSGGYDIVILDEANVANFADTLNEFAKNTQFVVVTHRRGTMERCQALYGVAMEERGVSRMVSVKLEDAS